jgi:hypothetical protein
MIKTDYPARQSRDPVCLRPDQITITVDAPVKIESVRSVRQPVVIVFAALIPALLTAAFHPRRPALSEEALPGEERLETVLGWGKTVLWIDARSAKEFNAVHVRAHFFSISKIGILCFRVSWNNGARRKESCLRQFDRMQVSHEVAERLKQSGISFVFALKGGWEAWKSTK